MHAIFSIFSKRSLDHHNHSKTEIRVVRVCCTCYFILLASTLIFYEVSFLQFLSYSLFFSIGTKIEMGLFTFLGRFPTTNIIIRVNHSDNQRVSISIFKLTHKKLYLFKSSHSIDSVNTCPQG